MFFKKSKSHLLHNNMKYWEHFKFAAYHGLNCIKSGFLLLLHALIPSLFTETGSILVNKLNQSFTEHNDYLKLKSRVEAFKKMVYTSSQVLTRECR